MTENTMLKLENKKIKLGKDIISVENLKIQICTKFKLKSIKSSSISLNYEYQNKSFEIVTNHDLNDYVYILESSDANNAPCINIILPKIIISNCINQKDICQEDEKSSLSSLRNDSPTCFRNQNVPNIKKSIIPNVVKRNKNKISNKKSNPRKEIKDENNKLDDKTKEFNCENRISDDLKKLFNLLKQPLPESKKDQNNDSCIDYINNLIQEKKFDECESLINDLIKNNPDNPKFWHLMAKNYMSNNKHNLAVEHLLRINQNYPEFQKHYLDLAICFYMKKEYNECLDVIHKILKDDKNNEDALYLRYKISKAQDSYSVEKMILDNLINNHEYNLNYEYEKARHLFKYHKYNLAVNNLNEIIKKDPFNPNYYLLKAKCFIRLLKRNEAEKLLDYIVITFPMFEKGKIVDSKFKLHHKNYDSDEVDDFSECHEFKSLSVVNNTNISSKKSKNDTRSIISNVLINSNSNTLCNEINVMNNDLMSSELNLERTFDDIEYMRLKHDIFKKDNFRSILREYDEILNIDEILESKGVIDELDFKIQIGPFNDNPKNMLSFNFKNYNYDYDNNKLNPHRIQDIYVIWDDLQEIFSFCPTFNKKSFKIRDIEKIDDHFFYNNKIYYIIKPNKNKEIVYFSIFDCFSHYLFKLIRDYLIIGINKNTSGIADYTKYSEIEKFFKLFKSQINSQITVYDLMNRNCTNRQKSQVNQSEKAIVHKVDEIKEFFITSDFKRGVTFLSNKRIYNYDLTNLDQHLSNEVNHHIVEQLSKSNVMFNKIDWSMDLKLVEDKYLRMNKMDRQKYRKMLTYEKKKNEDNCFLFALLGISNKFTIFKNANTFKNKSLSRQIELANEVLVKDGLILREKSITNQTLKSKIKTVIGESILIMYNSDLDVHAEAVVNGQFTDYVQDIISSYMEENLTILELKIEII
jgi:tetratricopeptide (TPR) repeat protein